MSARASDESVRSALRIHLAKVCSDVSKPLSIRDFWENVAQREKMLDEFCTARRSQRLGHLSRAIRFLKKHNVVMHGVLHHHSVSNAWHVTSDFNRVAAVGESVLRNDVCVRLLKLFPAIEDDLLTELLQRVSSQQNVVGLYDELELNALLDAGARRQLKVTSAQKYNTLLAILGEMQWFAVRTKATDRTHNNALFPPSDVLILHSLCSHSVESIIVESVMRQLVGELRHVQLAWKNYTCSLPGQATLKPRTAGKLSLTLCPQTARSDGGISKKVVPMLDANPADFVVASKMPLPQKTKFPKMGFRSERRHYSDHIAGMRLHTVPTVS